MHACDGRRKDDQRIVVQRCRSCEENWPIFRLDATGGERVHMTRRMCFLELRGTSGILYPDRRDVKAMGGAVHRGGMMELPRMALPCMHCLYCG